MPRDLRMVLLHGYPDTALVDHLLEMLRTHERSVAQKIERQKKAKWTEALNTSWKSRGNKLTHQVTSVRGNPFLTKVPGRPCDLSGSTLAGQRRSKITRSS